MLYAEFLADEFQAVEADGDGERSKARVLYEVSATRPRTICFSFPSSAARSQLRVCHLRVHRAIPRGLSHALSKDICW